MEWQLTKTDLVKSEGGLWFAFSCFDIADIICTSYCQRFHQSKDANAETAAQQIEYWETQVVVVLTLQIYIKHHHHFLKCEFGVSNSFVFSWIKEVWAYTCKYELNKYSSWKLVLRLVSCNTKGLDS